MSAEFDAMYSRIGRPSIPPEKLLGALLLQAFYTIRSERQLMEQMDYNLLSCWFVSLAMDAPIWDVTVGDEFELSITRHKLGRQRRALGYRKLTARPRHLDQKTDDIAVFKKSSLPVWRRSNNASRKALP